MLVATGSEVATLVEGANLLHNDGLKVRVVSVPSEGLFRTQPAEYRGDSASQGSEEIRSHSRTPRQPPSASLGTDGKIWGLESFGFSAPYKVLDEKLGFTPDNVYTQVKTMF